MKQFILVFSLILSSCSLWAQKNSNYQKEAELYSGWHLLKTQNYQIFFPKKPTKSSEIAKTEMKGYEEVKMDIYSYEPINSDADLNGYYAITEYTYPVEREIEADEKEILEYLFKYSIDGMIDNVNGRKLTETVKNLHGFAGREVRVSIQKQFIITARVYWIKDTMVMIMVGTDIDNDFNTDIDKFLDSFKLLN